jgi:hypothetical protein
MGAASPIVQPAARRRCRWTDDIARTEVTKGTRPHGATLRKYPYERVVRRDRSARPQEGQRSTVQVSTARPAADTEAATREIGRQVARVISAELV